MSKRVNKIRWRQSDRNELQRTVKNFNAKINRLAKNKPELREYLPEKVTKKEIEKSIGTRADLNRVLNSLQRFSRRGAESPVKSSRGAKATAWEVKEFNFKQKLENQRRKREREKINAEKVKFAGVEQDFTRAEMGSIKENSLKDSNKKFNNMSAKEWVLANKNIENALSENYRDEKIQTMRENYIKGLNDYSFLDAAPELLEIIENLDDETFLKTAQTDEAATFDWYKDPIAWTTRLETIVAAWKTAAGK